MEKQSPLISVIMPLYNAERFVGESIGNILGQTVGDFELIVIDDASTVCPSMLPMLSPTNRSAL